MTDLIRRLEEAKEGSRELECLLAPLLGWYRLTPSVCKQHGIGFRSAGGWIAPKDLHDGKFVGFDSLHGTEILRDPPKFTRNLQDAVSAVPQGWGVAQLSQMDPTLKYAPHFCELRPFNGNDTEWARVSGHLPSGMSRVSMAMAVCIAILRAMEAKNE